MTNVRTSIEALHHIVSASAFLDETEAVERLLAAIAPLTEAEETIVSRADALVDAIRQPGAGSGLERLLKEYSLETEEGVALMCLAEALLRIPDSATADALIRDKFESARWEKHLGGSDGWFVHASSWGLALTGKTIQLSAKKPDGFLAAMFHRLGEPVIREALKAAMRLMGGQFVLAERIDTIASASAPYRERGYRFSYDILGEGARSQRQAERYTRAYHEAIAQLAPQAMGFSIMQAPGMSVKLSALHPSYRLTKREVLIAELLPRLKGIALAAKNAGLALSFDAEEATRLDIEMLLFAELATDPDLAGWNGLGFVVQAYQKRAYVLLDWLTQVARDGGRVIPVRLVKGAYWDAEIKAAQIAGLPDYPVFTRKEHTDISYLACAGKLLAQLDCFYPQFATHNARTVESVRALAALHGVSAQDYEFQRLFGMGERLHDQLLAENTSRIYAPVGAHRDLLAYLIRRILENGSSTSFVHLLMDENVTNAHLLADPATRVREVGALRHPATPLPADMYADRINSRGLDFGNLLHLELLEDGVRAKAMSLKQNDTVSETTLAGVDAMAQRARDMLPAWGAVPVAERARILEKAADLIENNCEALMALLAVEGGKTLADGLSEVREAADFCRYYAAQAQRLMQRPQPMTGPTGESNMLSLHPRGVFACIAPWNFPLAIFVGQVAAALAAGNTVIAKPAAQTPRIAMRAVALLHQAGVPGDALQLAIGAGRTVGEALVSHPTVAGVAFTGSVATAHGINRTLAARSGPIATLIAETGGQNCMVVDSSALIEQAVDDIIHSAFGSAGQRCSALRVLYVQDDIADALLSLLADAMQELTVGDPLESATDIGPVIDASALRQLTAYTERMQKSAKLIAIAPLAEAFRESKYYFAPRVFEIKDISQLEGEVFGPILHVIRFKAEDIYALPARINATGFGLTFGMHSRIEEHIRHFTQHVHAGNIYINRGMTGAVVGVQPFGGERLSGTGFKAGGPNYLLKFMTERTISVNTAAIGGNLTLLSGSRSGT